MRSPSSDAPEIVEALSKANEFAELAARAETAGDREYYERMRYKWMGIADGWRVIVGVDHIR